jgi:hypothetical protein
MSLVNCPHCGSAMQLPENVQTATVTCARCHQTFVAENLSLPKASFGSARVSDSILPEAQGSPSMPPAPYTSGKAIASLALGILSLVLCMICSIPGLILGMLALREIKQEGEHVGGRGIAIAGLVFNFLGLLLAVVGGAIVFCIAIPNFHEAQVRAKVSRAQADMRSLAVALEAYHVDNNFYPQSQQGTGVELDAVLFPSLTQLTTPVAYITSVPQDPFANSKDLSPIGYFCSAHEGWALYSQGPDGHPSIFPEQLRMIYDLTQTDPMQALLPYTYDATNGTKSEGDIFRIKQ